VGARLLAQNSVTNVMRLPWTQQAHLTLHRYQHEAAAIEAAESPSIRRQAVEKLRLVNLGLICLSRGEWQMVMAITCLIQRRGWRHG
jgi:hypothetical protein